MIAAAAAGRAFCSIYHYGVANVPKKNVAQAGCRVRRSPIIEEREMNATRPRDRLYISQEVDT